MMPAITIDILHAVHGLFKSQGSFRAIEDFFMTQANYDLNRL